MLNDKGGEYRVHRGQLEQGRGAQLRWMKEHLYEEDKKNIEPPIKV